MNHRSDPANTGPSSCPKCSAVWPTDKPLPTTECPTCGVIFAKFYAAQAEKREREAAQEKAAQQAQAKREALARSKAERQAARDAKEQEKINRNRQQSALSQCSACGGTVAFGAKSCPHCGAPGPKKPPSKIVVAGIIFIGVFLTVSSIVSRDRPPDPGPFSIEQRERVRLMIKMAGYRCDSVSYMNKLLTKPGFRVTCNADRYVYAVVDEGGHWVVRLD